MVRTLGMLALLSLVGCGGVTGTPTEAGGGAPNANASSGGAGPDSGGQAGILIPRPSSGGTVGLGFGGAVSVVLGGHEVSLETPDPNVITLDPASTGTSGIVRLDADWTFTGLELMADQDHVWALVRQGEQARLLVFDEAQCGGPVGQITVPDELVQGRTLVLGEEALLSCGASDCLLLVGVELEVHATLPYANLSWLERSGATVCAGNGDVLFCQRGDGVLSEPLLWRAETAVRGRLADVGNCAVFEASQLCMQDSGAWEELPLAVGPPPPPTCETLWHAGAFELTRESLVEACAPSDGSPRPIAETQTHCRTSINTQKITIDAYFATCYCHYVG